VVRLPYRPRPGQAELAQAIRDAQRAGEHLVAEAGTGTGKTVTALAASLASCAEDGCRVVYATRTNSQQSQVVAEHRAILDSGQDAGLLVPFMGRRQYCPLLRSDDRFRDGSPEELGRLCRDAKRKADQQHQSGQPVEGACPHYARLLADGPGPVEALLAEGGRDGAELAARIEAAGSCPYEALKLLMPKARTVVVPLVFVLDDRLRRALLEWMGTGADGLHLVVDEAHHLPDAAREHHSPKLTQAGLERAMREAEEYRDPALGGVTLASSVVAAVMGALRELEEEYVRGDLPGEGDGLLPPDSLAEALMRRLRLPSPAIGRLAVELERWGEIIREDRRSKGRLPRSHLGHLGGFLHAWMSSQEHPYVHLVTSGDNPALELCLLDPAPLLSWLLEFRSTLHMSGTLAPLEDHANQCGLPPGTRKRVFPSPFSAERLRIFALEGVHRRYDAVRQDPGLTERQQRAARAALDHCPGRTGLFFPSHRMLQDYLEEGFLHGIGRPLHVERPEMGTPELVRLVAAFKADRPDALLLGVLGGRLSEGIDFPGKAMEHMVLFGVPYPRPTARLQAIIHHFDRKSGNGWQVAVHNPVGRTLRQTVGRLIRSEEDRGTALVLDERAVRFHGHLRGLTLIQDPAAMAAPPAPEGYRTADQVARNGPSAGWPKGDSFIST
jgi:DNA excision repair protein ERCC-2